MRSLPTVRSIRTILPSALLLLAAASTTAGDAPPSGNWPQWRGPLMNGVGPDADPPVSWSEGENVRWKRSLPGAGLATPIVWEDVLYILTAVYEGDASQQVQETPAERPSRNRGAARAPAASQPAASQPAADATRPTTPRDAAVATQPRRERARRGAGGSNWKREVTPDREVEFVILALDRSTGETLWQKTLRKGNPHEGTHGDGTWASASPATDGEVLIAHFGSNGTYALGLDGELKWKRDLGDMTVRAGFGEGSSPLLHGDRVIINWDHEGDSFVAALDRTTGKTLWQQARAEATGWSTPAVFTIDGKAQVVVAGAKTTRGYDLESGKPLWHADGMTLNAVPTPVLHGDDRVIVMSGFRGNALQAIDLTGATGDLSDKLAWSYDRDTPYVPSPLLYGDRLYFLKRNNAMLTTFHAGTGKPLYGPERLPDVSGAYASPVAANGRVYIAGRNGATAVLKDGDKLEVLAINELDDRFDASPALSGKDLFLRGRKSLYCLTAATASD